MNIQANIAKLSARLEKDQGEYVKRELSDFYKTLENRQKLGLWKQDDCPLIENSIDRIVWVLDGSYGCGAKYYAQQLIVSRLTGVTTEKRLAKTMQTLGRDLTILTALLDCTEYTARKISEVWKKQGTDFDVANNKAAGVMLEWLSNEFEA